MRHIIDTLKALCGCAVALALLLVFVVFGRLFNWEMEGERWYD